MAIAIIQSAREVHEDRRGAAPDVGWKGSMILLRRRGERSWPRMISLDGTVWLMSPTSRHQRPKTRLGEFVTEVVAGLRIPFVPAASTTLRRRAKKGGVEGDQTFYLANEGRIRGKERIDPRTDLPPDLAIEIVCTHDADEAIEVYRRLRVPEVWACDEAELAIRVLPADGRYSPSATGAACPSRSAAEVHGWDTQPQSAGELEWITALRRRVGRTLRPRVRRQRPENPGESSRTAAQVGTSERRERHRETSIRGMTTNVDGQRS